MVSLLIHGKDAKEITVILSDEKDDQKIGGRDAFPYFKILEKLPFGLHDQLVPLHRCRHTQKFKNSDSLVKSWCFFL